MEKSESITKLAVALKTFQSSIEAVKKDGSNPFYKSKYATLDNIWEHIRKPLASAGLAVSQMPSGENELTTVLLHESGEYISATAKMTPKENSPQAQGSAITYLRRYAISALLGLTSDEDDDGNAATKPVGQAWTAPKTPQKTWKAPIKAVVPDTANGAPFGN